MNINHPLVSIVVPIYKVPEKYLRHCIESCINQTLKKIEIILVDDGSPDDCGKICDEYATKDSRIKVIHKQNGGLAAARNSGLSAVNGETMMFLDGDDFLELDCCKIIYNLLIEKNVQIVLFDQKLVYQSSVKPTPVCSHTSEMFSTNHQCRELQARILDFNGWVGTATSKLVRMDYLKSIGFKTDFGLRQGVEGFISNIVLFEHVESAYYIHQPFYNYVYNDDSITHTPNLENNLLLIKGMEYIEGYANSHPVSPSFRRNLLNRILYIVITAAIQGCFSPTNPMKYKDQVQWFSNYLNNYLIKQALVEADRIGINGQRKVVLFLIEHKLFRGLQFLAYLRKVQLKNR